MQKEKKQYENSQNSFGVIRQVFNLDTRSAIVAAVVVSVVTLAGAFLVDLCNYVYWYAYFTRFRIPMAYFEHAIIPESGLKYTIVMCIPVLLGFWWRMHTAVAKVKALWNSKPRTNKLRPWMNTFCRFACWFLALVLLLLTVVFILEYSNRRILWWGFALLLVEVAVFILWTACRESFGYKFRFSGKTRTVICVIAAVLLLYGVLGGFYFSGSMENYVGDQGQSLKILSEPQIDTVGLEEKEEVSVQLVLLETEDHYYVTQAQLRKIDGAFYVRVWDRDTYRFVDKIDRPVSSIYASLWHIDASRGTSLDHLFTPYMIATPILVLLFMCLLSIPKKEN